MLKLIGWMVACFSTTAVVAAELVFKEELRIASTQDGLNWQGPWVSLAVNGTGHMLLVDPGQNRILHYDPQGSLLGLLGKEGGQSFRALRTLSILDDGTAIAYENHDGKDVVTLFDKELVFVEQKTLPPKSLAQQSVFYAPDGKSMASYYYRPPKPNKSNVYHSLLSADRGLLSIIAEFTAPDYDDSQAKNPQWWATFLTPFLKYIAEGQGLIRYAQDSSVYTARSHRYHVQRLVMGGDKPQIFSRSQTAVEPAPGQLEAMAQVFLAEIQAAFPHVQQYITPQAVQQAMGQAGMTHTPALYGLVPMPNGKLLVVSHHDWQTRVSTGDVFDQDGTYLGSSRLPPVIVHCFGSYFGLGTKLWFSGDKAYALESFDGKELFLVRYGYHLQ